MLSYNLEFSYICPVFLSFTITYYAVTPKFINKNHDTIDNMHVMFFLKSKSRLKKSKMEIELEAVFVFSIQISTVYSDRVNS